MYAFSMLLYYSIKPNAQITEFVAKTPFDFILLAQRIALIPRIIFEVEQLQSVPLTCFTATISFIGLLFSTSIKRFPSAVVDSFATTRERPDSFCSSSIDGECIM